MKIENTAAYQGRGWKPRHQTLGAELNGRIWQHYQVNSEWSRLEAVLIYRPQNELRKIRSPQTVQHLQRLKLSQLKKEYAGLVQAFRRAGVKVVDVQPVDSLRQLQEVPPNLMFMRDLFFSTPGGCVVGRTASRIRAGEEKFAAAALANQGVPICATISGRGLFEGADALWLTPSLVAVGVGNRTNRAGFNQLSSILRSQGIRTFAVTMPRGVQHLLGILQIVGPKLCLIRKEKAPPSLLRRLRSLGFRMIAIPESDEVRLRQGFNIVCLGQGRILMPTGCPELRAIYRREGLRIFSEVPIHQICRAAGGLACATGILSRRIWR